MIPSPFWFEDSLTAEDYQKLGKFSLRWSHIDHLIANCLKKMLCLSDDEARIVVFPLNAATRLQRIRELQKLNSLPTQAAQHAFDELDEMMDLLRPVRNNVIHAVIMYVDGAPIFELRSHGRQLTKEEVFETEELTNYAAQAAWVLRHELGDKDPNRAPDALPTRPPIPDFLKK
jgi:hypothetical protein